MTTPTPAATRAAEALFEPSTVGYMARKAAVIDRETHLPEVRELLRELTKCGTWGTRARQLLAKLDGTETKG
jgi:hypothetical protein